MRYVKWVMIMLYFRNILYKSLISLLILVLSSILLSACQKGAPPPSPSEQLMQAEWWIDHGDTEKGMLLLEEIIKKAPKYEPAHLSLSSVYIKQAGLTYVNFIELADNIMLEESPSEKQRRTRKKNLLTFLEERSDAQTKKWIQSFQKLLEGLDQLALSFDYFQKVPDIQTFDLENIQKAQSILLKLEDISQSGALYRALLKVIVLKHMLFNDGYFKNACHKIDKGISKGVKALQRDLQKIFADLILAYPENSPKFYRDLSSIDKSLKQFQLPEDEGLAFSMPDLFQFLIHGELNGSCP